MKKKLLTTAVFLSICIFSTKTFAQTVPGGDATGTGSGIDGGTTGTTYTCPQVAFKRNNGNGTCLGYAQIRAAFTDQSTTGFVIPTISGITYQGQPVKYNIPTDGIYGIPTTTGQGYISYCLGTMDQFPGFSKELNNIPPAYKLYITFKYPNGQTFTIPEND